MSFVNSPKNSFCKMLVGANRISNHPSSEMFIIKLVSIFIVEQNKRKLFHSKSLAKYLNSQFLYFVDC